MTGKVSGGRRPAAARVVPSGVMEPPVFSFPAVRTSTLRVLTAAGRCPPCKLTMVTAPIGYGKTVLLSAMYESFRLDGGKPAWFSLDERDTTIERLLNQLGAFFGVPEVKPDLIQAMHQGEEGLDHQTDQLIAAIDARDAPETVFIDNLNHCGDAGLWRLLNALIFRTRPSLHLVLSSTSLLKINATRAKLQGLAMQVGLAELSLDRMEVIELLGPEVCARLSPQAIDGICLQTEGWPAAVRLMKIVLSGSEAPESVVANFSGMDEDLGSMLNRQLLQGFEPGFRAFLLAIALLRTFDAELASAASQDPDAAGHIERLWQQSLFIIPLDRNRSQYRLHTLFKEHLQGEARRSMNAEARHEVLKRAALFCRSRQRWDDAINYAFEAEAIDLAAALLDHRALMVARDRGDLRLYLQWVEQLHASGESGGWETDYWYVWSLVFHRRYESARRHVARLTARLDQAHARDGDPQSRVSLQRRVDVIRIALAVQLDQLDEMARDARLWLQVSGEAANRHADDAFDVTIVACASVIGDAAAAEMARGRQFVGIAQTHAEQSGNHHAIGWAAAVAALIPLREGEYPAAYRDLMAAYQRCRSALGEHAGICGLIALLAAKCAVEMNLREEAAEHLALGLRKVRSHGIPDIIAYGLDAAVKLWDGGDSVDLPVARLRQICGAYPTRLATMLSCFVIRRLIRLGRVSDAEHEANFIDLLAGDPRKMRLPGVALDLFTATRVELLIALGRLKQAGALAAEDLQSARQSGRQGRVVELLLDEATIALATHDPAMATRQLARAIALAARRRLVRPFLDRQELLAALVNQTRPRDWHFALAEEQAFFAELCRGLPTGSATFADHVEHIALLPPASQPPTERELALLSLIEAGFSNQQIADHLTMSVPTVKWHLYNLYAKLGVRSRAAALARARALSLLAR